MLPTIMLPAVFFLASGMIGCRLGQRQEDAQLDGLDGNDTAAVRADKEAPPSQAWKEFPGVATGSADRATPGPP